MTSLILSPSFCVCCRCRFEAIIISSRRAVLWERYSFLVLLVETGCCLDAASTADVETRVRYNIAWSFIVNVDVDE